MQFPVLKLPSVYHLGSLNRDDRGYRGDSLEGHCLSVSLCPEAWRQIAKLGGAPLNRLTNPQGIFLDVHGVMDTITLRSPIEQWGIENQLAEIREMWRVWGFDSETDEWRYMLMTTKEQAIGEADGCGEFDDTDNIPAPPGHRGVESAMVYVGTLPLAERVRHRDVTEQDAFDFVLMAWAEDTQPEIDGLWWRETYDPDSLSAPRGGILPGKLENWTSRLCNEKDPGEFPEEVVSFIDLDFLRQKPQARRF